jgi:hypothetical protein
VNNPNRTPGKMKLPRALELLNAIIDHMIELEGGHANRVIPALLEVGFTAEELVEDFCFPEETVKDEAADLKEDSNGQNQ